VIHPVPLFPGNRIVLLMLKVSPARKITVSPGFADWIAIRASVAVHGLPSCRVVMVEQTIDVALYERLQDQAIRRNLKCRIALWSDQIQMMFLVLCGRQETIVNGHEVDAAVIEARERGTAHAYIGDMTVR
jgi:hypothetical protein